MEDIVNKAALLSSHKGPSLQKKPTRPVFDQPVVLPVLAAVAHSQHAVVQFGAAAAGLIVDAWDCTKPGQGYEPASQMPISFKPRSGERLTRRIKLEGRLGGVDADGDRSNGGHGLLQGLLVELSHVHVAGAFGSDVLGLETAGAVLDRGGGRV